MSEAAAQPATAQLSQDHPVASETPGSDLCLASPQRVSASPVGNLHHQGQRQEELAGASVHPLRFQLILTLPHFTSVFSSQMPALWT